MKAFHIIILQSKEQLAIIYPFGEYIAFFTWLSCPSKIRIGSIIFEESLGFKIASTFHNLIVESADPVIIMSFKGEKSTV